MRAKIPIKAKWRRRYILFKYTGEKAVTAKELSSLLYTTALKIGGIAMLSSSILELAYFEEDTGLGVVIADDRSLDYALCTMGLISEYKGGRCKLDIIKLGNTLRALGLELNQLKAAAMAAAKLALQLQ